MAEEAEPSQDEAVAMTVVAVEAVAAQRVS